MNNKNPLLAFFLSFLPGFGHLYLNRKARAFFYGFGFFGLIGIGFLFAYFIAQNGAPLIFFGLLALMLYGINILDMLIHLLRTNSFSSVNGTDATPYESHVAKQSNEKFYAMILALIPGLGHFHIGLMNRGLSFLFGFFGLFTMVVFIGILTDQPGFLVFLLALPIIWLYNLFDVSQLLNRKQRGEELVDTTIFEELDKQREAGKKSKVIAMLLSMFPGAGHMYLGLQRRGLQLMAAFLFSIYILDTLRLSLFLFLIPIIWFYSFFDSMQQLSRYGRGEVTDEPIVTWLFNHQRWVALGLIALGVFYLFDQAVIPLLDEYFINNESYYWYKRYMQTAIVSTLLIGGGIKLLMGSKGKGKVE